MNTKLIPKHSHKCAYPRKIKKHSSQVKFQNKISFKSRLKRNCLHFFLHSSSYLKILLMFVLINRFSENVFKQHKLPMYINCCIHIKVLSLSWSWSWNCKSVYIFNKNMKKKHQTKYYIISWNSERPMLF